MSFIWWYLLWSRVTWRGQIEVKHILRAVTLTDVVKFTINPIALCSIAVTIVTSQLLHS